MDVGGLGHITILSRYTLIINGAFYISFHSYVKLRFDPSALSLFVLRICELSHVPVLATSFSGKKSACLPSSACKHQWIGWGISIGFR